MKKSKHMLGKWLQAIFENRLLYIVEIRQMDTIIDAAIASIHDETEKQINEAFREKRLTLNRIVYLEAYIQEYSLQVTHRLFVLYGKLLSFNRLNFRIIKDIEEQITQKIKIDISLTIPENEEKLIDRDIYVNASTKIEAEIISGQRKLIEQVSKEKKERFRTYFPLLLGIIGSLIGALLGAAVGAWATLYTAKLITWPFH